MYVSVRYLCRYSRSEGRTVMKHNCCSMDKMGVLSEGPAKSLLAICTTDGFGLDRRKDTSGHFLSARLNCCQPFRMESIDEIVH